MLACHEMLRERTPRARPSKVLDELVTEGNREILRHIEG